MDHIVSEPLLVIGEGSTLNRLNFNNLPPHTKIEISGADDLAKLKIRFNALENRQIFLNLGKNDYLRKLPMVKFQSDMEKFVNNLSDVVGDRNFLNLSFIKPRYHANNNYEEEQRQAHYISLAYSVLLNHYPQTIMFTQDSRDPWVSQAYKSLFFDMIRHPVANMVMDSMQTSMEQKREREEREANLLAIEEEKRKIAEAEKLAREQEELARQAEAERLLALARAEEEERLRVEEEERLRRLEEERIRIAEEEAERVRLAEEEAERLRIAEEEKLRLAEEERIRQEEEEAES